MKIRPILDALKSESNYRSLPSDILDSEIVDFSSNDYLGLAQRLDLKESFFNRYSFSEIPSFSSSASRLLAASQDFYGKLENKLARLYGDRDVLLFNSGYHANTGIIQAVTSLPSTLVVADKLVHASIIDGIRLADVPFKRFRHKDMNALESILQKDSGNYENIFVIVESVYSMDGDRAPLEDLSNLKNKYPNIILYVDEAHAFGVEGPKGLGLTMTMADPSAFDIVVGTFGKAAASFGAFVVTSREIKEFLINKSRSFIFSTSLPPIQVAWTDFIIDQIISMDQERQYLKDLGRELNNVLNEISRHEAQNPSHIQPLIIGDSRLVVNLSASLWNKNFKVLPIRRPTVMPGTERLRFSLSASMTIKQIKQLRDALRISYEEEVLNK